MNEETKKLKIGLDRPLPLYHQLTEALRTKILDGEFTEDEKLPSETEFSRILGVNNRTLRKALDVLEKEGLLMRIRGKGTFVKRRDNYDTRLVAIFMNHQGHLNETLYNALLFKLQQFGYVPTLFAAGSQHDHQADVLEHSRRQLDKALQLNPLTVVVDLYPHQFDYNYLKSRSEDIRHLLFMHKSIHKPKFDAHYVIPDTYALCYLPITYLHELGHKQLFIIMLDKEKHKFTQPAWSATHEIQGYRDALQVAGLNESDCFLFVSQGTAEQKILEMLRSSRRPTAVVAYQDSMAALVINLAQKIGLNVPADLAVVGRFNTPWTTTTTPSLTSFSIQEDEIARQVVEKIEAGPRDFGITEIKPKLIIRESCGNVRQESRLHV